MAVRESTLEMAVKEAHRYPQIQLDILFDAERAAGVVLLVHLPRHNGIECHHPNQQCALQKKKCAC